MINTGMEYDRKHVDKFNGLLLGLYYNVQGPVLQYVGIADRPDIYTLPFHSLDFNFKYKFGKEDRISASLKVSNILNDKKENVFRSFMAQDQYFSSLHQGRTFSFKISLDIR